MDLARRALDLRYWYTNEGLLPNHTVLWSPPFEWQFSFFFTASGAGEAAAWMLACAVAYAMLLAGYRTRLAQILSFAAVLSLHTRTSFVGNWGDVLLGELALLTAFLPTGRRYSLDALLARAPEKPSGADTPESAERHDRPIVSLAVLALTLQLATVYLFNALNESGPTWREGSVVHYILHQDNSVTAVGVSVRGFLTPTMSRVMTYTAWATELALPVLLVTPFGRRYARSAAVIVILLLHAGFGLLLNLGVFVPAMMAFGLHFIPKEDMDAFERRFAERLSRGPVVRWFERIRASRLLERRRISAVEEPFVPFGARAAFHREAIALALMVTLGMQVAYDNPKVSKLPRESEPTAIRAVVSYLQALEAWDMYAPDPPKTDANVSVQAITAEGRHVDPLNEVASPRAPRPGITIPARLGQDNLFYAYVRRIPGTPNYHQAFTEWILRYPERTGRPNDRIVSFEAFVVEDDSPEPGERKPKNPRGTRFLRYPEN